MTRFILRVPALAQDSFAALLAGCPRCRHPQLRFRAFEPAQFDTLQGDVVSAPKWSFDEDSLPARTFRVDCLGCRAVLFERDDCPACRVPRALGRALEAQNGLPIPPACPRCGVETLTFTAELRMHVESLHGHLSRRRVESEPHEPGFHVTEIRCPDCDDVVARVDGRCILCGRSSLLKALR
jgi:hypothetical protein